MGHLQGELELCYALIDSDRSPGAGATSAREVYLP
jgi:hypothetical protein